VVATRVVEDVPASTTERRANVSLSAPGRTVHAWETIKPPSGFAIRRSLAEYHQTFFGKFSFKL
jgi:hypothetical protein